MSERAFRRSLLIWKLLFATVIALRLTGAVATPWSVVLAPLWFGPALWVTWRVGRAALIVATIVVLRVLVDR